MSRERPSPSNTAAFLLNLAERSDRLERFTKDAAAAGLEFTRVEGVDGRKLSMGDRFQKSTLRCAFTCSPGAIGCYLGHMSIMKEFLKTDKQWLLTFEDDAGIPPNFWEEVANLYMPEDAEFYQIAGPMNIAPCAEHITDTSETEHPDVLKVNNWAISALAFLASRRAVELMVEKYETPSGHFDLVVTQELNNNGFGVYMLRRSFIKDMGNMDSNIGTAREGGGPRKTLAWLSNHIPVPRQHNFGVCTTELSAITMRQKVYSFMGLTSPDMAQLGMIAPLSMAGGLFAGWKAAHFSHVIVAVLMILVFLWASDAALDKDGLIRPVDAFWDVAWGLGAAGVGWWLGGKAQKWWCGKKSQKVKGK